MKAKHQSQLPLHLMLLPGVLIVLYFSYGPMFGLIMSFQDFNPALGFFKSKWIWFDNFSYVFMLPGIFQVIWNTIFLSVMKIIASLVVPITISLLLNEINNNKIKRTIQTMVYLPHFMSWVIISGILIDILSPQDGIVNKALTLVGIKPIFFLGNEQAFPFVMLASHIWKEFGFDTIIYLAALTSIDPTFYEAAIVDGANRWKQTLYITLPCLSPTIVLMLVLSLGNILNAGFDQIFNLYSPQVYKTGDIIDTMVYRIGLINLQYSTGTAVGLMKSVISCLLIVLSFRLAEKYANYRIF